DHFAALALENSDAILARSQRIVTENLAALSDWLRERNTLSWVAPQAGTTALLKYPQDTPSEALCVDILSKTGVMLTPGSALNMEGYMRIGYANHGDVLRAGLKRLEGVFGR
ncbi:MAG: aminotransferase, partial [Pseudomonadota bacterium]